MFYRILIGAKFQDINR